MVTSMSLIVRLPEMYMHMAYGAGYGGDIRPRQDVEFFFVDLVHCTKQEK